MHTIVKIAVVSVLSLFAIVGLVSISKAETWSCSYLYNGEANIKVMERKGDSFTQIFKVGDEEVQLEDNIIFEDEELIHLHFNAGFGYYATVLNKEENSFSMVGLDGVADTDIITGKCKIN